MGYNICPNMEVFVITCTLLPITLAPLLYIVLYVFHPA